LDSEVALRESLIREQLDRINLHLKEYQVEPGFTSEPASTASPVPDPAKTDWLESWLISLELAFRGGLREDSLEFQKRLVAAPKPTYPALAQRAGLQGNVVLQLRLTKDGRVEVQKLVEGDPALADAAIAAIKQWRGKPLWVNGKPVEVISNVTFNFQLH
jgi:TonB family protein